MGRLTYGFNVSVDGYVADKNGDIGWSTPDEELHQYWNNTTRDLVENRTFSSGVVLLRYVPRPS